MGGSLVIILFALIIIVGISGLLLFVGIVRALLFLRQTHGLRSVSRWLVAVALSILPMASFLYLGPAFVWYSEWCDRRGVSVPFLDPLEVPIGEQWSLRIWTDAQYKGINELWQQGPRASLAHVVSMNVSPPLAYGEVRYSTLFAGSLKPTAPFFVVNVGNDNVHYASDLAAMTALCRAAGVTPAPLITPPDFYKAHRWYSVDVLGILALLAVPVLAVWGLRHWRLQLLRQMSPVS